MTDPVIDSAVAGLVSDYSVEVTPREPRRHPGVLRDVLPPGTRVYVTYLANASFDDTVAAVDAVTAEGMVAVPHLAARSVADVAELDTMTGRLAGAGAHELLVIAGSIGKPAGAIDESLDVLRSGALERHGFTRVAVAGHPEGNKDIGDHGLARALREKNAFAAGSGVAVDLVTQFCFAADPIISWERSIREAGNRLPVRVGLPGLSSPGTLLKFGLSCGVGPSIKVLRKQSGGLLKLATTPVYHPDRTLVSLAAARVADPESLIAGVHFFPFGALVSTVEWLGHVADGRFSMTEDDRLEITG